MPFAKCAVVFALLVAMAGTGFAHRVIGQDADESLLSYLAAGGTLAELCGQTDQGSHGGGQSCDACRLVDSLVVPSCVQGPASDWVPALVLFDPGAAPVLVADAQNPAHPVRAPPVI